MKKVIKLTEKDLTRIIKRVINEGPYDDIDFSFMDDQNKVKESMKIEFSENFYNRMVKDRDLLKGLYNFLDSNYDKDIHDIIIGFKRSEYSSNIESYMDTILINKKYSEYFSERQIYTILDKVLSKFISDAYDSFIKRRKNF